MMKRILRILILVPVLLILLVSGYLIVAPGMAMINWIMDAEGGFWRYLRTTQRDMKGMVSEDAKRVWRGSHRA